MSIKPLPRASFDKHCGSGNLNRFRGKLGENGLVKQDRFHKKLGKTESIGPRNMIARLRIPRDSRSLAATHRTLQPLLDSCKKHFDCFARHWEPDPGTGASSVVSAECQTPATRLWQPRDQHSPETNAAHEKTARWRTNVPLSFECCGLAATD